MMARGSDAELELPSAPALLAPLLVVRWTRATSWKLPRSFPGGDRSSPRGGGARRAICSPREANLQPRAAQTVHKQQHHEHRQHKKDPKRQPSAASPRKATSMDSAKKKRAPAQKHQQSEHQQPEHPPAPDGLALDRIQLFPPKISHSIYTIRAPPFAPKSPQHTTNTNPPFRASPCP